MLKRKAIINLKRSRGGLSSKQCALFFITPVRTLKTPTTFLEKQIRIKFQNETIKKTKLLKYLRAYIKQNYPLIK